MQETKAYAPNGSNYHDHRCSCPGCNYDGPDPTDAEIEKWIKNESRENAQHVMKEITRDHTDEHPFCDDPECGCKLDMDLHLVHIDEPYLDGLLTVEECQYI